MKAVSLAAIAVTAFVMASCADKPVEQVKSDNPVAPPVVTAPQMSAVGGKNSTICKSYRKELGSVVAQLAQSHSPAADLKDAKDALDVMVADACK